MICSDLLVVFCGCWAAACRAACQEEEVVFSSDHAEHAELSKPAVHHSWCCLHLHSACLVSYSSLYGVCSL